MTPRVRAEHLVRRDEPGQWLRGTEHAVAGPINLGNLHTFTMAELVTEVLEPVGGPSELIHQSLPADEAAPSRTIEQARRVFDWSPVIELDEGLTVTVDYVRRYLDTNAVIVGG